MPGGGRVGTVTIVLSDYTCILTHPYRGPSLPMADTIMTLLAVSSHTCGQVTIDSEDSVSLLPPQKHLSMILHAHTELFTSVKLISTKHYTISVVYTLWLQVKETA